MTQPAQSTLYLRMLAALAAGLVVYWLLMSTLSRAGQGYLLLGHGLAATTAGIAIGWRRFRD
jgi:hypothetical protein